MTTTSALDPGPGEQPARPCGWYFRVGKPLIDVVAALLGLLLLAPLLALIALAIWLEDRGPPLFRQVRVGAHERPFVIFKFRTMPVDVESRPSATARDLPRTRVGHFLRRFSLDELPQLINVVLRDMSLVGPRPGLPVQGEQAALRRANGSVALRPGITGLAQIRGHDGMSETDKATWDGRYLATLGPLTDLRILLGTVAYLLRPPPVV